MSFKPVTEAHGSNANFDDLSSLGSAQKAGTLKGHTVENARSTCFSARWVNIALMIGGVVGLGLVGAGLTGFFAHHGMLPTALAKLNSLGALGQTGSIIMMASGSILTIGMIVGLVRSVKRNHDALDDQPRRRVPGESEYTIGGALQVESDVQANTPKSITYIGTPEKPLDEVEIRAQLALVQSAPGKIDALVIYGNGSVKLNTDPGVVRLNPKKLILVGARIVHTPTSSPLGRLDDTLAQKPEWQSSAVRMVGAAAVATDPNTFVTQYIVASVEEAFNHELPPRGGFKGRFHAVYQVRLSKMQ